jgi:hypothetical protein
VWRAAWKPEYWRPKIRLGFSKRVSAETKLCRCFRGNGRESTVPEATGLETYGKNLEGRWSLSGPLRAYLRRFFLVLVCEAIGTAVTAGLLCQPRVIVKMIVEKQMECRLTGETEVLGEHLPQRHFCPSQNPTWPDPGLNPGRRRGKPATNRLSTLGEWLKSQQSVQRVHSHTSATKTSQLRESTVTSQRRRQVSQEEKFLVGS